MSPRDYVPKPRNVEKLCRWLLCVTGCLPLPLEDDVYLNPYFADLPMYRDQRADEKVKTPKPLSFLGIPCKKNLAPIAEEAQARCCLFVNPTPSDILYTENARKSRALLRAIADFRGK
jgi:hypothetical protein